MRATDKIKSFSKRVNRLFLLEKTFKLNSPRRKCPA
jgi:hypothetical protein